MDFERFSVETLLLMETSSGGCHSGFTYSDVGGEKRPTWERTIFSCFTMSLGQSLVKNTDFYFFLMKVARTSAEGTCYSFVPFKFSLTHTYSCPCTSNAWLFYAFTKLRFEKSGVGSIIHLTKSQLAELYPISFFVCKGLIEE